MKIAICDDEARVRTQALTLLHEYASQNESLQITSFVFEYAEDLLEAVGKLGGFDAYILDIVMPGMNGIELGTKLRETGCDGKILYLTSSEEYAIDSFRVKAFNYLLKPIEKETFFAALDEVTLSISTKKEKSFIVKTKENSMKLTYDSVMYAVLSRRVIVYHLINGKTVESLSLRTTFSDAVQELLKDNRFVLCGTSMIANLHHITMVEKDALLFKNTQKVYLSKKACSDIRSAWCDFWFDGEGRK